MWYALHKAWDASRDACVRAHIKGAEFHRHMVHDRSERRWLAHVAGLNESASLCFVEPGLNGDEAGPSEPDPPDV